ncbi:MAG: transposase [Candidatus Omnitrophica bacterium]|nr:transposase [Candidatus Omnitrophota bacterium]
MGCARVLVENACYHLMARGNQKQLTFREEEDYKEYLQILRKYKVRFKFKLYAYCLMPNHIHLIGQIEAVKDLSKFVQGMHLTYTLYFNQKYSKVGHLWQGRFKSKVILKDKYLIDCLHYIELNPVRRRLVDTPYQYPWSSYRERELGDGFKILDQIQL